MPGGGGGGGREGVVLPNVPLGTETQTINGFSHQAFPRIYIDINIVLCHINCSASAPPLQPLRYDLQSVSKSCRISSILPGYLAAHGCTSWTK
jgi:hypothetical protein